jgi:hypothetical protein
MQRRVLSVLLMLLVVQLGPHIAFCEDAKPIDATTLHRKVLCGYQGWFRCAGDAAGLGWRHWSRDGRAIGPKSVTVEMWPEMSEYGPTEQFPAGEFKTAEGKPATLFSSVHPDTVERHFRWMREYGIDGVFLQRFLVELKSPALDIVLANVRQSAAANRRTYAICYDMSGARPDSLVTLLGDDWKRLVEVEKVTQDANYLHHNGKPVVFVWGFYSDRFDAEKANAIIDLFKADPKSAATLIGGCQWYWRTEKDEAWQKAFRRLDVISPWNVGNSGRENGEKHASTGYWKDDLAECRKAGVEYLPVIYPGFAWTNLKGEGAASQTLPRLDGRFFWRQFVKTSELGLDMAYVAMFDEVDEGTAIFKVTNSPPANGKFTTYEGLPPDWYLRLTAEGTKLLRKERERSDEMPIKAN